VPPEEPPEELPTEVVVEEPTAIIPGLPPTGYKEAPPVVKQPNAAPAVVVKPQQPVQSAPATAPLTFRVFYDRNRNSGFNAGEGIRGIKLYFLNLNAGLTASGDVTTAAGGTGNTTLPVAPYRISVPYLGINIDLRDFPGRELHSLWLPPVSLPDRVP
jgi:hypothetical protein